MEMLEKIFVHRGQQHSTPGEPDLTLIALTQSTNTLKPIENCIRI